MAQAGGSLRFYRFYFEESLEAELVLDAIHRAEMPHRLHRFRDSAYAGALSLGRGWGWILIPEGYIAEFMELTGNRLAPEVELHEEDPPHKKQGCLGFWNHLWR